MYVLFLPRLCFKVLITIHSNQNRVWLEILFKVIGFMMLAGASCVFLVASRGFGADCNGLVCRVCD